MADLVKQCILHFLKWTSQIGRGKTVMTGVRPLQAEEKYFKNVAKIFEKLDTSGGFHSQGNFFVRQLLVSIPFCISL